MEINTEKNKQIERIRINEGSYEAVLVNVKEGGFKIFKDKEQNDKQLQRIILDFEMNAGGKVVMLSFIGFLPARTTNKLGKAFIALGCDPKLFDGHKLQTEDFIGHKALVFVENYDYEDKTKGIKLVVSGISKVRPVVENQTVE